MEGRVASNLQDEGRKGKSGSLLSNCLISCGSSRSLSNYKLLQLSRQNSGSLQIINFSQTVNGVLVLIVLFLFCYPGITSASLTNPIWLVKTRMQLEARVKGELGSNAFQCAMHVYRTEGLHGFYRGITASYAGVSETIIHFVIYEALKQHLRNGHHSLSTPFTLSANSRDFFGLMGAAAVSKTCASCIAYPHEVIRTRLREEGSRYRSFIQTLQLIVCEEGPLALYRGLLAHLIRQIPNTAIMMATYELIVRLAPPTL